MSSFLFLHRLPDELLEQILGCLETRDLRALSGVSRWTYGVTIPHIWRDVELVDRRTRHDESDAPILHTPGPEAPCLSDEHDDTPLIKKLIILAINPKAASCVQCLTLRCHLPGPSIFEELPLHSFCAQTLSHDQRTIKLVQLAAANLINLQTLRIILGHANLTDAFLRCLFDAKRVRRKPITRLWLENCRISSGASLTIRPSANPYNLPSYLDFAGLRSIRFRRMPLRPAGEMGNMTDASSKEWVFSRGGDLLPLVDGQGGRYFTTLHNLWREIFVRRPGKETEQQEGSPPPPIGHHYIGVERLFAAANTFDDAIYTSLASEVNLPESVKAATIASHYDRSLASYRGYAFDTQTRLPHPFCMVWEDMPPNCCSKTDRAFLELLGNEVYCTDNGLASRQTESSASVALSLLHSCATTLRSLCLDWVYTEPQIRQGPQRTFMWQIPLVKLFMLRFPHLRAFQARNTVTREGSLPEGLYLLDSIHCHAIKDDGSVQCRPSDPNLAGPEHFDLALVAFMEYHHKLQCLGWPMDKFFQSKHPCPRLRQRIDNIIDNLSQTLADLRVDTAYLGQGESVTEEVFCSDPEARTRRRAFVSLFASRLRSLKSMKLEGGIPRDERRETLRALHACPLEKVVLIGVNWPLGNTWGRNGEDASHIEPGDTDFTLEGEDKDAVHDLGMRAIVSTESDFRFDPVYGWPASAPMLHTIASFYTDTIKELKFCGYQGSPDVWKPTAITTPMLFALKQYHKLESFIFSMYLNVNFEGGIHDPEVIRYWIDSRSPSSTALTVVTDEPPSGWHKELRTKFAPDALAWRVTNFIGPFLSEEAKSRKGGVHVRASFCLGMAGLFDLDCQVGKGALGSDVCLSYKGPREEIDPERRQSKLDNRRWF